MVYPIKIEQDYFLILRNKAEWINQYPFCFFLTKKQLIAPKMSEIVYPKFSRKKRLFPLLS